MRTQDYANLDLHPADWTPYKSECFNYAFFAFRLFTRRHFDSSHDGAYSCSCPFLCSYKGVA
jgi:hypothetical protein